MTTVRDRSNYHFLVFPSASLLLQGSVLYMVSDKYVTTLITTQIAPNQNSKFWSFALSRRRSAVLLHIMHINIEKFSGAILGPLVGHGAYQVIPATYFPVCLSGPTIQLECNMFHLKAGQTMLGEKQGELYEFELNTVVH